MTDTMSIPMSVEISGSWDQAISDATERLKRVEAKARRLREAIQTFKESKEAGEPWVKVVTRLHTQESGQTENAATQN